MIVRRRRVRCGRWGETVDQQFDARDDQDAQPSSRHSPRDAMFLHVELCRAGSAIGPTLRVRNLSPGGMMVETAEPFACGDAVIARLRNLGDVAARVAWIAEGRVGIAFDAPIDPRAARTAPPKSPGSTMTLVKAARHGRRPGLKTD